MRRNEFDAANTCFDEASKKLEEHNSSDVFFSIAKARIYAAKSMNYINRYINKEEMNEAMDLMKIAINILEEKNKPNISPFERNAIKGYI
jgi:hypothetical protein